MRKLIGVFGATIFFLTALPASAQKNQLNFNVFDLGTSPIGTLVDLSSWACGNITINNYDNSTGVMTITFNVPSEFIHPKYPLTLKPRRLAIGEISTVRLKNSVAFSFYWKSGKIDGVPHVLLVVNRHCPKGECVQLCSSQNENKTTADVKGCEDEESTCLSITVNPWAIVKWGNNIGEASRIPLIIKGLPIGTYTFEFDHPFFILQRKIIITGAKQSYHVNLFEEAPAKSQLNPKEKN